ncbi:MAG: lysophospholipid acyltransferase family protein [Armatimonadota bacterium]
MIYRIARFICLIILKIFGRIEVIGHENIPKSGGVLICANHISYIDPPAIGVASKRSVHFMAKKQLFEVPILKFLMKPLQTFPVNQRSADRMALRKAIDYINNGEIVAMFPEGQRNLSGKLMPALPGAGMIALNSDAVVIPAAVFNTEKMLPKGSVFLRFTKLRVVFGKPMDLSDLKEISGRDTIEKACIRIMDSIGRLLEEYKIDIY